MRDETMPEGRWAFDAEVAAAFDDMLERSIPQYDVMRATVTELAALTLERSSGSVLDLGCSRGGALGELAQRFPDRRFVGVDASEPMVNAALRQYAGRHNMTFLCADLRDADLFRLCEQPSAVTLLVLTLQFVPPEHRPRLLGEIYAHSEPGGRILLVEKLVGQTPETDADWRSLYRQHKLVMGYSEDAIDRKALSLEGVLIPTTAAANEELLRGAGFGGVECFWRWACFAGWTGVRPR